MKQRDIAARLDTIEALVKAHVQAAAPAIENSLDTYGQVGQLREVYAGQREQMKTMTLRLDQIRSELAGLRRAIYGGVLPEEEDALAGEAE
jgi:hypothetical protein